MKKSWKILGELMGNKKQKNDKISLIDENTEISGENEIANKFADYFGQVGESLDAALHNSTDDPCTNIVSN